MPGGSTTGLFGGLVANNAAVGGTTLGYAPYGLNPTQQQQNQILSNPALSAPAPQSKPSTGSVLGASTQNYQTTSSSPSGITSQTRDPQYDAYLAGINSQFDRNLEELNAQLGIAEQQKNQGLTELSTAQRGLLSTAEQQKQAATTSGQQRQAEAGNIARQNTNQARNVLRALGILNSTYAADKLTQPSQEFEKARAAIQGEVASRVSQIDDYVNQKQSEFLNATKSLEQQYVQLVDNIQRDIRFTDRSRADAINAANAAFQDKLAQMKQGAASVVNQANQLKQNFVSSLLQQQLGNNPELLTNPALLNQYFTNASSIADQMYGQPKQVGISGADEARRRAAAGQYYSGGLSSPVLR